MAKYLIQSETLTSLGDKIRAITGTEETLTPAEMQSELNTFNSEIAQLVSEQDSLISQIAAALEGKTVATPNVQPLEITESGTYEAPSGIDGYSPVIVDIQSGVNIGTFEVVGTYKNQSGSISLTTQAKTVSLQNFGSYASVAQRGDLLIPASPSGYYTWAGVCDGQSAVMIGYGQQGTSIGQQAEIVVLRNSTIQQQ